MFVTRRCLSTISAGQHAALKAPIVDHNNSTCGIHHSLPRDLTMLPQSFRGPLNPFRITNLPSLHPHSHITTMRSRGHVYSIRKLCARRTHVGCRTSLQLFGLQTAVSVPNHRMRSTLHPNENSGKRHASNSRAPLQSVKVLTARC